MKPCKKTPQIYLSEIDKYHYPKTTIECLCGYIATFESYIFICPDCGREYQKISGNTDKTVQTKRQKDIFISCLNKDMITEIERSTK